MNIVLTPDDIIKRCLWSDYKRFCLSDKSDDEIKNIIIENLPISLKEEDAYVIGLLKIVETHNLVHRLKEHINEILKIRSNIFNGKLYIIKSVILKEISLFNLRFPDEFKAPFEYKMGIDELKIYSEKIYETIDKLPTEIFQIRDKNFTFVSSNSVKDIIENK